MSIQDQAIAKVQKLPDILAQEVNDFVDFLLLKHDTTRRQYLDFLTESSHLGEAGLADYLPGLTEYEERLARGEIQW
jgi:uncharacterized protein DUF2281